MPVQNWIRVYLSKSRFKPTIWKYPKIISFEINKGQLFESKAGKRIPRIPESTADDTLFYCMILAMFIPVARFWLNLR